jgi:hypothetical protein
MYAEPEEAIAAFPLRKAAPHGTQWAIAREIRSTGIPTGTMNILRIPRYQ